MHNTLICTVGTSLFYSNLNLLDEGRTGLPENWMTLKKNYLEKNWPQLVIELLKLNPGERICGAEINTINELGKKNWFQLHNLIFLVSDTDAGVGTGKVLKAYFEKRADLNLKNVEYKVVEGLQDKTPTDFKLKGLRNLVREIGHIINRFGSKNIAIDATGGYKAQIAIAVLIGLTLDIPVYYKHELFNEIIDFPALPVSLDYDLLGRNAGVLAAFEKGTCFTQSELKQVDDKIKVFLNEVEIEGDTVYELSALGQLYVTSFRLRYPKAASLIALNDNQRKKPTFRDDTYPNGFKDFVTRVWHENAWIKTCWSLSYHGQQGMQGISFDVDVLQNKNALVGTYMDNNNFKAPFQLILSDNSNESLNWAADYLNRKYNMIKLFYDRPA